MEFNETKNRMLLLQQYMKFVQAEIDLIESGCSAETLDAFVAYPVMPNCSDPFINSLQFPQKPQLIPYTQDTIVQSKTTSTVESQEYFSTEAVDEIPLRRRGRSYSSASSKSNKHSDNEADNNDTEVPSTRSNDASAIKYTYGKNSKKVRKLLVHNCFF